MVQDLNDLKDVANAVKSTPKEDICKVILGAIAAHEFIKVRKPQEQEQEQEQQQKKTTTAASLGENLIQNADAIVEQIKSDVFEQAVIDATAIVRYCEKILSELKSGFPASGRLSTADESFSGYLKKEYKSLDNASKILVKKTIYNLVKNQLYLIAITICKQPDLTKFATTVLAKLQALNEVKEIYARQNLDTPPTTLSGGSLGATQMMHKCLYKAHKHMYLISKQM